MESTSMKFGRYDFAAFLTFASYAACSVIIPVVLVQMTGDLKFKLGAGGALQMGRTISMIALLVLSGFIAGRFGKCRTMGLFICVMGLGILLASGAPSYTVVFFALLFAGCGEGYIEGIATPFVQDLHPGESGRYLNFTHGFWSVGVVFAVLGAGFAITKGVSWRWIVALTGCLAIIPSLLLLLPSKKNSGYPEKKRELSWRRVAVQALVIFRVKKFWLFFFAMFLAGGGEYCLTFWLASLLQLSLKESAWAGGLCTAAFAGGMAVGRTGWGFLIRQNGLARLVFYSALCGAFLGMVLPCVALPLTGAGLGGFVLFCTLVFLIGVATAPFWPSIQSYAADRIPGTDTTMLFILLSCAGVPGCGFFAWTMGILGDACGLLLSFYLVPLCYATLALLLFFEMRTEKLNRE